MPLLLGTDEAGYGPNLGPLVIGLSAWQIPSDCLPEDLATRLQNCVADHRTVNDPLRIPLADSKQLYQSTKGLATLEQATLAAWSVAGINPKQVSQAWLGFETPNDPPAWHSQWDHALPICPCEKSLQTNWAESLREGLSQTQVSLLAVRGRLIQPVEFNRLVAAQGSKGSLLSEATLQLVRKAVKELPAELSSEEVLVICDKHGGRDRYAAVLQHVFPDHRLAIVREGRRESVYRLADQTGRKMEFRFRTQGEEWLPTALASMTAKYLRELAMLAFNAFWLDHLPGIKPTAGYPQDAIRFREEIATVQKRLAIPEEQLWRCR